MKDQQLTHLYTEMPRMGHPYFELIPHGARFDRGSRRVLVPFASVLQVSRSDEITPQRFGRYDCLCCGANGRGDKGTMTDKIRKSTTKPPQPSWQELRARAACDIKDLESFYLEERRRFLAEKVNPGGEYVEMAPLLADVPRRDGFLIDPLTRAEAGERAVQMLPDDPNSSIVGRGVPKVAARVGEQALMLPDGSVWKDAVPPENGQQHACYLSQQRQWARRDLERKFNALTGRHDLIDLAKRRGREQRSAIA